MSPGAILAVSLVAFLSAPAAIILLWVYHSQTHEPAVRDLAYALLGLAFVLLGNLLTAVVEGFAPARDYGLYFLLLDEVAISSLMMGGFICRFAHRVTGTPVTPLLRFAFWAWAFLVHTGALAVVLLPVRARADASVSPGFTIATIGAVALGIYASAMILARRRRIPGDFALPRLPRFALVLLPLPFLAAASDILKVGQRLGGQGIPLSPLSSIIINGLIIAGVGQRIVGVRSARSVSGSAAAEFGLTVREAEILPLLLEGASNEAIGERLNISPHTVKNHVTAIYRKTGTENRFNLLKSLRRPVAE